MSVILLIILSEIASFLAITSETFRILISKWLKMIKDNEFIDLGVYLHTMFDKIKEMTSENTKLYYIPIFNLIHYEINLHKCVKDTLEDPEFIQKTRTLSSFEKDKIAMINENNKGKIITQLKEITNTIKPVVDTKLLLKKKDESFSAYELAGAYSFLESEYLSSATREKIVYGVSKGVCHAVLSAIDLDHIRELLPDFEPLSSEEAPTYTYKVVSMIKPNEADICYIVSEIVSQRFSGAFRFDEDNIVDVDIKPVDDTVKLTK